MASELTGLIQNFAPAIVTALGGPLAGAAVQALATALGQDQPDIISVTQAAKGLHPEVLKAAAERADAAFVQAVTSVAPQSYAPPAAPVTTHDKAEKVITDAGVTNPTAVMIGSFAITAIASWMASKGWASSDMTITLLSVLVGLISSSGSAYWSWASNTNTKTLMGSKSPGA